MRGLPGGVVTFLFTDIEGSTRLLRAAGEGYASLLETHRRLIRTAIGAHSGHEVGTEGDSFFVAFARPIDALEAAVDAQLALGTFAWPEEREVRVRMGIHTGEASVAGDNYIGMAVHQAARTSSAAHGGQILISSTTAKLVLERLNGSTTLRDIGVHRLKDIDPQQLFQVVHPGLRDEFDAPTSVGAFRTNLPAQLTSFVGRDGDVAECKRLLTTGRLLTLTGAGGVGKTRLAIEVARVVLPEHPHGVWMADLASLADAALVPQVVSTAAGLVEQDGAAEPWTNRLIEHLRGDRTLLLLDNCEHLLSACADLVISLLRSCPEVRVLATSREPLGLEGELAWRVPSLAVEGGDGETAAARLFIERAREIDAGFSADAETVAQICRHLDGIPLAIELAAARTQALSATQILERLDDRFHLLRSAARRRIERQQTLRAAIDWSHDLLSERDRTLLRRTAVFSGGFTLEAAEAVCSDGDIEERDVLELLEGLVRKSLVVFDVDAERGARYRLLETIRQYGLEHLVASGEATQFRNRHRDFFRALAEQCHDLTAAGRHIEAAERAVAEINNLRSALEWTPEGDDGQTALVMCGSLSRLALSGHFGELLQRTIAALDADPGPPSPARLLALSMGAMYAFHQSDLPTVERLIAEGLEIAEALDDRPEDALARAGLLIGASSIAQIRDSDYERALALCREAEEIGRRANSSWAVGWALFNIGHFQALLGDFDGAAETFREARSPQWDDWYLATVAQVELARGNVAAAQAIAEEALSAARRSRNPLGEARALGALSRAAIAQGNVALARASAEEQITVGHTIGEMIQGVSAGLENLVTVQIAEADFAGAEDTAQRVRAIIARLDYPGFLGLADCGIGEIREVQGDLDGAKQAYEGAVANFRAASDRAGVARALQGLASIAAKQERNDEAAELCAAIEAERAGAELLLPGWWHLLPLDRGRWLAEARGEEVGEATRR